MKVVAVNSSPRKKGNTATLLQRALDGAATLGAETELVQLSALAFRGCRSCFACKRVDGERRCYQRDDLSPVLEQMAAADAVILGSPIYFARITADLTACLERFAFPYVLYSRTTPSAFPHKLNWAMVYTMNANERQAEPLKTSFCSLEQFGPYVFGSAPEVLCSYNTWQYPDYDKYLHEAFPVEDKRRQRDEQWPIDCQNAFELGVRLAQKAAEQNG